MLPLADAENVDPQMPSERFSWQGAREFDEKSSLLLRSRTLGVRDEFGATARARKYCYISDLVWQRAGFELRDTETPAIK
jgi:hypothetical protein